MPTNDASRLNGPDLQPIEPPSRQQSSDLQPVRYFLAVFLISAFFLGRILWPFWSILVLSFLLTSMFRPVYAFLHRWLPVYAASILTCVLIVALVFVPLLFFTGSLAGEALNLYNWGRDAQVGLKLQTFLQESPLLVRLQQQLLEFGLEFKPTMVTDTLTYLAKEGGLFLYKQASAWAANIMQFLGLFFMMILVIFFLLIDLPRLIEYLIHLSPLPDDEDRLLLVKFEQIANAILIGNGICGLIQGILGGGIYSIMGLNSPILWGCIMAVLAFLPIFGIGLVMIPTAVILAINGRVGEGIFLFCYYFALSMSVEYLLKPKLVGRQVKMHTLLVLLAILGGLAVYGILGIIYGPIIVTAFLTLSDIYLNKYDQNIERTRVPGMYVSSGRPAA
ncbi:MAG: AI-2E family transporter [Desulfoprunum sp.]|jgi:predicted PurR-regulated permease PerM|uniref:AI-2E family transporter n=1 Tax=Desulfoprunum sp. TaxID=2020866 RepID=UPI000AAD9D44